MMQLKQSTNGYVFWTMKGGTIDRKGYEIWKPHDWKIYGKWLGENQNKCLAQISLLSTKPKQWIKML